MPLRPGEFLDDGFQHGGDHGEVRVSVKVGQNIPRSLYQAVAEVLAYVYRLKKGNP